MKLLLIPLISLITTTAGGRSLRSHPARRRELLKLDGSTSDCVVAKNCDTKTSGNKLVLEDIESDKCYSCGLTSTYPFEDFETVMFAAAEVGDSQLCMQATHGDSDDLPEHGEKMRLYECDATNPLQLFEWVRGTEYGGYGHVVRLKDTEKCVQFQGSTPNVGDEIVIKDCNRLKEGEEWSLD